MKKALEWWKSINEIEQREIWTRIMMPPFPTVLNKENKAFIKNCHVNYSFEKWINS